MTVGMSNAVCDKYECMCDTDVTFYERTEGTGDSMTHAMVAGTPTNSFHEATHSGNSVRHPKTKIHSTA